MKWQRRKQTFRFHPYKIRDEITWKFIQEKRSVKDFDKPTFLQSGLKMETTQHPKNGEHKHGNSDEGRNFGERKSSRKENTKGKKLNFRYHPYKKRDEATRKIFPGGPSEDDIDKPTLLHSGLKVETPQQHPKNGESKHGNSDERNNSGQRKSSKEESDKTRGKKRERDNESDQSADEERTAKKARLDAVGSWAKTIPGMICTAILPKKNNKRPASDAIFPAPPNKKQMTIADETSKNDVLYFMKLFSIDTV